MSRSVSISTSMNMRIKLNHYYRLSSRFFFQKILATLELLLTQSGVGSNKTLSFSSKKCKIELLILNTSNLSSNNLIKREF